MVFLDGFSIANHRFLAAWDFLIFGLLLPLGDRKLVAGSFPDSRAEARTNRGPRINRVGGGAKQAEGLGLFVSFLFFLIAVAPRTGFRSTQLNLPAGQGAHQAVHR